MAAAARKRDDPPGSITPTTSLAATATTTTLASTAQASTPPPATRRSRRVVRRFPASEEEYRYEEDDKYVAEDGEGSGPVATQRRHLPHRQPSSPFRLTQRRRRMHPASVAVVPRVVVVSGAAAADEENDDDEEGSSSSSAEEERILLGLAENFTLRPSPPGASPERRQATIAGTVDGGGREEKGRAVDEDEDEEETVVAARRLRSQVPTSALAAVGSVATATPTSRNKRDVDVRILPGHLLPADGDHRHHRHLPGPPPAPPDDPPPIPRSLCRIVVLGDQGSGKTSAVRRFVRREYCCDDDDDYVDGGTNNSSTGNDEVIEMKQQRKVAEGGGASAAGYHRKDVALWHRLRRRRRRCCPSSQRRDDCRGPLDGAEAEARCVRVQIWDVNGVASPSSSSLIESASAIVLTCPARLLLGLLRNDCRCGDFDRDGGGSDLEEVVSRWMNILRSSFVFPSSDMAGWCATSLSPSRGPHERQCHPPDVTLLLTMSDLLLLPTSSSCVDWITIGSKLERLCLRHGIARWKLGSCRRLAVSSVTSSIEENREEEEEVRVLPWETPTDQRRRQRELEAQEDAIERVFLDAVRCHLNIQESNNDDSDENNAVDDGRVPEAVLVSPPTYE